MPEMRSRKEEREGTQRTRDVLLVEDDPDRVHLTRHALESVTSACRLTTATTGDEALGHVDDDPPGGFDLVLLDLDLPDLSGHEVCRRIRSRANGAHPPIVVLSSSDESDDIRHSYRSGANGHVAKAVDFDAFRQDVEAIVDFWLDVNKAPSAGLG